MINIISMPMSLKSSKIELQTLVFIKRNGRLLLGYKKRGFGVGKWNGYGGKLERGERIIDCAIRELLEESKVRAKEDDLNYLGFIDIRTEGAFRRVHIFACYNFVGEPVETDEMRPRWFEFNSIPFKDMWEDTRYWIDYILQDQQFEAAFTINNDGDVLQKDIKPNIAFK